MNSIWTRSLILLLGFAMLPSCTAKYEQLLRDKDSKIRELYTQVAELTATNQDLDARERGARSRVQTLEQRLAARLAGGGSGLDALRKELKGVDVTVRGNRLSLGINNTVTFTSGSTKLKASAGSVLKRVARVLNRDFPGPIRRTKNRFRDNRHLSVERADAVARFLIKNCGIKDAAVVVAGYGQYQPLTRSGNKSRNRRVEIVIAETL